MALRWTEFPETQHPPLGWTVRAFSRLARVIAGQSPASEYCNQAGDGLPFLQGNAEFGTRHPCAGSWCTKAPKGAPKGSILISVRAPVGEINVADREYAIGRGLAAIQAEDVHPGFLYHALQRWKIALQRVGQGTTFDAITAKHFRQLRVAVPPSEEQRAIAAILDAADAAIERTREAVSAVERLKRALMQRLLPPWIGFKRVADDALPTGVEGHLAGTVCHIKNGSTPSRTEYLYWSKGTIPWLATGKVNERIIRHADEFVTEKALAECSIELLPAGTVLVGMIGQGRTRGMAAYLDMSACINQNFGAFVPGEKVVGKFLYHYLCFHYDRLRDMGGGTNQGALNCYMLKRIRLALPKPEVQREIAQVLDACDALSEQHQQTIVVLQRVKRGLMQDLLTGKVRAPITLEVAGA